MESIDREGCGSDTAVYRAAFDWASTEPSTGVVEAVAAATGREPLALGPLYESVDPDALGSLLRSSSGEASASVSFAYAGREVTVHGDGRVAVRPPESGEPTGV